MNSLFNMDNRLFGAMSRLVDIILLNFIFILCCIPIVTIGASITSMYYVCIKMVRNEDSYLVRSYFKSFKTNFKQATIIWIGVVIFCAVLLLDTRIIGISFVDSTYSSVFQTILWGIMIVFALFYNYIFPVLSRFDNTIRRTLTNSIFMAIRHLPWTLMIAVISIAPAVLLLATLKYGILIVLLAGFSGTAYINSLIFNRIFSFYIPDEESEEPDLADSLEDGSEETSKTNE